MKRVYFQPVGDNMAQYTKCVDTPIDMKELKGLISDDLFKQLSDVAKTHTISLWGVANGKDGRTKTIWESMDIHDWVIFTSHRTFWSAGEVFAKEYSEAVSKKYLKESGFGNIYFVIDRKNIDVPTKEVVKELNFKSSKIDSTNIVRRFDGMGLSKNPKITKIDQVDNEKLLNYLQGTKAKANIDVKAAIKRENEEKAAAKKPAAAKPAAPKKAVAAKPVAKKAAPKPVAKKPAAKPAAKKTTTTTAKPAAKKPAAKPAPKKAAAPKPVAKAAPKKVEAPKPAAKQVEPKPVMKEEVKTTTKVSSDVLRIRPITNLNDQEIEKVLNNLPTNDVRASKTFADKYYVLDDGTVIMIPTTTKEFKKIKKFVKRTK